MCWRASAVISSFRVALFEACPGLPAASGRGGIPAFHDEAAASRLRSVPGCSASSAAEAHFLPAAARELVDEGAVSRIGPGVDVSEPLHISAGEASAWRRCLRRPAIAHLYQLAGNHRLTAVTPISPYAFMSPRQPSAPAHQWRRSASRQEASTSPRALGGGLDDRILRDGGRHGGGIRAIRAHPAVSGTSSAGRRLSAGRSIIMRAGVARFPAINSQGFRRPRYHQPAWAA